MSGVAAIHQVVGKSSVGYSISDYALALQEALREWGYESMIYSSEADPDLAERVRPLQTFHPRPGGQELLLLHYVMATETTRWARETGLPLILFYHNVTPSHFFSGLGGALGQALEKGRAELPCFRAQTRLALAASAYSRQEMVAAGYDPVYVQPILVPDTLQQVTPDPGVLAQQGSGPNLLFVGRLAPNKRAEDIVKILYYYRQIDPAVRLFLVGARRYTQRYANWLRHFVQQAELDEAVIFTGHVSQEALAAYYRIATVFVMMSEHEGFGIPLVESMRFDVPVVAYSSTAVPETLGGAGMLIHQKNYAVIAELLHLLHTDADLRAQIVARQRERVQAFAPQKVKHQFRRHIEKAVSAL